MKYLILLILCLSHAGQALEKQTQYWGSLSLIKPVDEKWVTSLELINRYSVDNGESFVKSTRLGLGYKFENAVTYTLILEDRRTNQYRNNEKRLIHQFAKKWPMKYIDLSLRYRQEQRKFENSEVWMNRSIIRAQFDFITLKMGSITPYYSSEHKYILNTVEGRKAGYTEARNLIGLDIPLNKNLTVDLAYMDRRTFTPSSTQETLFQVVVVSAAYKF